MVDVDNLETVGTAIDEGHDMWNDIEAFVRNSAESTKIGEFRKRAHGVARRVTEVERLDLDLPEGTAAVLWWIDGDTAENELAALDEETWTRLTENSTEATVERIIAYYRGRGRDDGHPAYALFEQRQAAPPELVESVPAPGLPHYDRQ